MAATIAHVPAHKGGGTAATVQHEEGQHHPLKVYFVVWGWLLVLNTLLLPGRLDQATGLPAMVAHPDFHADKDRANRSDL